jgi:outer membrane protein TolC
MASHFILRVRTYSGALLWKSTIISIFAGALCTPAFSAETPLTLDQAQTIALGRSRQLSAQDSSVLASQEMAVAAGQLPDPVLKLGVDNLPVNSADRFSLTDDFMTMRKVGLMQEITAADKRQARAERYDRLADKSRAEKKVTVAAIERDTAIAWLDRFYTMQMAELVAEQIAQSRLEIQSAESAYRTGRGSQADIFAARSGLALMEDRASEIRQRVSNTKTVLSRWIGSAADSTLSEAPPTMDTIHLNPAMLESQLEHHPEIAVLNQQVNIAQADANLAKANRNTDWSVELAYQQRGSAYSNMVSIAVSIPLQWDQKNRQDRELYSKLAMVEQASAERDEMLRQHVAETRSMMNDWQNDRERLVRFDAELLPLAVQRIQAVLAAYRGGKATLSDVLAARRSDIDIRIQALQLQLDTARLWAQLNFLSPTGSGAVITKD